MVGYLLDTNIVSAVLDNDRHLVRLLRSSEAAFLSSVVLGELMYGAHASSRVEVNLAAIGQLRQTMAIIDCDSETANIYGEWKAFLRRSGTPIPDNDLWIAAQAFQHDLVLVTRDRHFDRISSLAKTDWRPAETERNQEHPQ